MKVVSVMIILTVATTMATPVIHPANDLWSRVPFKPSLTLYPRRAYIYAYTDTRVHAEGIYICTRNVHIWNHLYLPTAAELSSQALRT